MMKNYAAYQPQGGIALILVVSVLAIVSIMATAFAFTMRLEANAASNYLEGLRANYVAEMGILHARELLKRDMSMNNYDCLTEPWRSIFAGSDVDCDGDGIADAKWIPFEYEGIRARYAVLVSDENGLLNLNTAGEHNEDPLKITEGASAYEVSLKSFFETKGIKDAGDKASAIISNRYGTDSKPGVAGLDDNHNNAALKNDGIDNNADGLIDVGEEGVDEPDEFLPGSPHGDDSPFFTKEQVKTVAGITPDIFKKIQNEVTVYSRDEDISTDGSIRFDLNRMNAEELYSVLKAKGASNPWQYAVNIADFCDRDYAMSVLSKPYRSFVAIDEGTKGEWYWITDHYENDTPGSVPATWSSWHNIQNGEYTLRLFGRKSGDVIGDVTINEILQRHMIHGEAFTAEGGTVTISDGGITLGIQNNEPQGTICYFRYIELSPKDERMKNITWTDVRGIEAIRINEVLVKPKINAFVSLTDSPGGDWIWQDGYYLNMLPGGGAKGAGEWTFSNLKDGHYYLTVFGSQPGAIVGDVKTGGATQRHMKDGERFTQQNSIVVSGGRLELKIENNEISGVSTSFKGIELSQEPDAEYIELVNLSPKPVSVAGWKIEGPESSDWTGLIPQSPPPISPFEYLVLAMDADDACPGINGNGISFERSWGRLGMETSIVQLEFSRAVAPAEDLIKNELTNGVDYLTLRDDKDNIVDMVEYLPSQVTPFKAIEKGSPAMLKDSNGNGIDDYWETSEDATGGTGGLINENKAMYEYVGEKKTKHKIEEVMLRNMASASVGGILDVPNGEEWARIGSSELAKFADRLTVKSLVLQASGAGKETGGWTEVNKTAGSGIWFESNTKDAEGVWEWTEKDGLKNGVYILRLYGAPKEEISISIFLNDDTWAEFTPSLIYGPQGAITYGKIEIGTGGISSTPDKVLKLKLRNDSKSGTAHFEYVTLSPEPYNWGRVNINTASEDVLRSLPGIDRGKSLDIISNRPFGDKNSQARGIGDIINIVGPDTFRGLANLITVRSNIFEIISTAQILEGTKVAAERKIRAIVER